MIGTDHLLSKKLKTFSICNAKVSNSYLSNAKVSKSVASANFSDPNKPSLQLTRYLQPSGIILITENR